ncbi:nucleoside triphosphate pyrophosphohydrolase [uncultured Porticoccus sp.]|uniref:nucleoside triphosphate pyrophosphohydrolase n=1 Tax=uncultured Porticoccus sp. TaxID=1256050 RepID=UPI0026251767|nr:nucleoside triphosphate pyrophosphohydrolase [uncultured Porticoccus sp.]
MADATYTIDNLCYLMERLRKPGTGCPWDLKQTFKSLAPCTLEEAYEVIDAIEHEDYGQLKEESGDLLFQVIFYSQLGKERNLFDFEEVVSLLVKKLISRHPHVFPEGTLTSERQSGRAALNEQAIKDNWESIKQGERKEKGQASILDDIPLGLPALTRATKLQKRAARHGFDWPDVQGVLEKINEETRELNEAIAGEEVDAIEEELGDVLFTVVNLCRHLKVDAETALRRSSLKFEQRINHIEESLHHQGKKMVDTPVEQLDDLWAEAKFSAVSKHP